MSDPKRKDTEELQDIPAFEDTVPAFEDTEELQDIPAFEDTLDLNDPIEINNEPLVELPKGVSPLVHTSGGALIGKGAKEGLKLTGKGLEKAGDISRQVPIIGDAVGAYKYASEGESVVGEKARKGIIKDSEDLSKKVTDKLKKQKKTASSKIGKTLDLLDKKVPEKNFNEHLNKIERSLDNIDTPTEESEKTIKELKKKLETLKKTDTSINIKKSGVIKSGKQEAIEKLKTLQKKLASEAEELGEVKSFSPIKIDEDAKLVKSTDLREGRVKSYPIKSADYTPIEIETKDNTYFKKMKPSELKSLEKSLREIKDVSKQNTQAAQRATGAFSTVKDVLNEEIKGGLGEKGLDRYLRANEQYRAAIEAEDLIPSLKKGEKGSIDLSDFLRKSSDDTKAGDKRNQLLEALLDKLKNESPENKAKLKSDILKVSDKYDLSDLTRKIGVDSTSLRNMIVRGGDVVGRVASPLKKVGSKIIEKLPLVGAGVGLATSFSDARAEGLSMGDSISEALTSEGIDALAGPLYPERLAHQAAEDRIFHKIARGEKITPEEYKKVRQETPEVIEKQASEMLNSDNKGVQNFGEELGRLEKVEDQDELTKSLYKLQQQPAFREIMRRQGAEVVGSTSEGKDTVPSSVDKISQALDFITSEHIEGGFQKQKSDKGNFLDGKLIGTNRGITPAAYKRYYGNTPTEEDMKKLTKEQAKEIYRKDYLENPDIDKISDVNLQTQVLDFGINSGPNRAIKELQKLVGSKPDGIIGPDTLKKVEEYKGDILSDYSEKRREFIKSLSRPVYEKGWLNRIDRIEDFTNPKNIQDLPEPTINRDPAGATSTELVNNINRDIDRVGNQISSGDSTPINQLDSLLEGINRLNINEEDKSALEDKAVKIKSITDGENLKQLIARLKA